MDSTNKPAKQYLVLKLRCPYCGEEKYVVLFCEHCGANMEFVEQLTLTKEQLSELMSTENVEFLGHPDRVSEAVSSLGGEDLPTESAGLSSLSPQDIDSLYDDGSLSVL